MIWQDKEYSDKYYNNTQKYQFYTDNKNLIKGLTNVLDFETVLDVGCGNPPRFKDLFNNYTGLDINYNGIDLTSDWGLNKRYDLVLSNLCLMCIAPDDVEGVFDKMIAYSNKWVVAFEELPEEDSKEKWKHDYSSFYPDSLYESGKFGKLHRWYIWNKK